MAITINGSGTITGISAGGLPDNCVTAADLATTLDLSSNTVTLPSGTGGQVIGTKFQWMEAGSTSVPSASWTNTPISFTYTPVSDSSVLSITVTGTMGTTNNGLVRLVAGSTNIIDATAVGSSSVGYGDLYSPNTTVGYKHRNLSWHYAPGTSGSAITFTLQALVAGSNNTYYHGRMASTGNNYNITSGIQISILEYGNSSRSELT